VYKRQPHTLADVWDDIRRVGVATGTEGAANALAERLGAEVEAVRAATKSLRLHPRVACIEWLDPLFNAGHWVPEMVECAGGIDVLAKAGKPSVQIVSNDVVAAQPEVIVIMPCGYDAPRAAQEFRATSFTHDWRDLPAVRSNSVFAVDANSYFSRSGPRLAQGTAILAQIFHSDFVSSEEAPIACQHINIAA